jgi:hypothetical protein
LLATTANAKHIIGGRASFAWQSISLRLNSLSFLANATHFNINIEGVTANGQPIVNQMGIYKPVPQYLFSIRIDYSNFDTVPPSVRIIDPFTGEITLHTGHAPFITPGQQELTSLIDRKFEIQNQNILLKDHEDKWFFCLRGLKEYHEHPQHSGDSWFLHRTAGKGNILEILDHLQLYSISNLNFILDQQKQLAFPNG